MNEGLLLSVAAALWLGCYLVVVKRYFSHYPPVLYVALSNTTSLVWYLPVVLFTVPADERVPASLDLAGVAVLAGTAVFTGVALLSFYHALAIGDVSYVAPLSKIVPVFVLPLEVVLLDQRLSALQIAGVVVATLAVYVANYRTGSLIGPLRRIATNRAAGFALLSAATFGVVDVGKRVSMQELAVPPETFVAVMLVTVLLLVAPFAVRHRGTVDARDDAVKLLAAGLLVAGGQHLIATAFQTLPASVVSPVVNTQAVVAVVLGSLLLDESHFRTRLAAAGLAVGGIALITLG
ncbi:EamA family transporter [Halorientalis brevis]|uniref:EamA family transporter n=1 Tax=Halorientalis brevis TaxID=1126241 RepID=A0ABD6CD02_9EURY